MNVHTKESRLHQHWTPKHFAIVLQGVVDPYFFTWVICMKWKDCPAYPNPSLQTWCRCGKLPIFSHSGTQQPKPGTNPRLGSCPMRLHHSIPELPVCPTIPPATLSPEEEWGEPAGRQTTVSPAKVYVDIDLKGELPWGHQSNLTKGSGCCIG